MQVLDLLGRMKKDIPLIFLVHGLKRETAAEFILKGAAECIEMDSIGHLPVAIIELSMRKRCAINVIAPKRICDVRKHVTAPWQEI